jgi:hypothetical protein
MTAQEQQMIEGLAQRINSTPLAEKDDDAEQFLQQSLGRNPDALYILAQTVLVQQYAMEQLQKQLADARAQLEQQRQLQAQPKHATSFLGSLLGHDEPSRPAPPPPPPPPNYQPGWAPVQAYPPAGYPPAPSYFAPQPVYGQPQSGGFLRSAMQTATGVAAGALAFEGIESLMHGFGGGGYGGGFGSEGGRPEEIINNYYGDSSPGEHGGHLSSDIEDRRDDSSSFTTAADRNDHGDGGDGLVDASSDDTLAGDSDSGTVDDSGDDSSFDDSSSFDDGGSGGDDSSY